MSGETARARMRGATFYEMIVVLALVGILAALALPSLPDIGAFKGEGATRKVMRDLRHAQAVAVQQRRTVGVRFNMANNRYRVFYVTGGTNVNDPVSGAPGVVGGDWTSGLVTDFPNHPELSGARLGEVNPNISVGLDAEVRFDSMGRARNASGAVLDASGWIQVQYGFPAIDTTWTVYVDPQTGRVNFERT